MTDRPSSSARDADQLLPRLTRYLDYFQAVAEVGKALTKNLRVDDVLVTVGRSLSQLLRPSNWSLLLVDEQRQELYFKVAVGEVAPALKDLRLKIGEGIAGWVARYREPVVSAKVSEDARFSPRMDAATSFKTGSIICVPLVCRDRVVGVLELVKEASDPELYGAEHLELLMPLADFYAIAIDNARTFERVQELTTVDEWTGLHNARFLLRFLEDETRRARRYHHELSIVFFDLDRFKSVNDTHGHAVGSAMLRHVGQIMKQCIRDTDRAVRYGGDEFCMVMPETPKGGALVMAERVRSGLSSSPFLHEGTATAITASFGVATFPADGPDGAAVLAAADQAMYVAKSGGRNAVVDAGAGH